MDASTSGGRKRRSVRVGREIEQPRPTIPSILKRDTPTENNIDADFEAYWEGESKNKNRNRIRVGRQYQATVPPLLKPGETDGRKCEDLETLRWKPDNNLSEQQLDQYLSVARAVSLFARAFDTYQCSEKPADKCLQTALRGLSEFVTSHHPCHHDAGCQVPSPASRPSGSNSKCTSGSEWTPAETQLFAKALEACGKNFGAIKKDYLPWKPVKSIIEYYYQGKDDKTENSSATSQETKEPEPAMSPTDKQPGGVETKVEVIEETVPKTEDKQDETAEANPKDSEVSDAVEVKPVNPKLVQLLSEPTSSNSVSTLGSLQFYLGGRLVLKLNAQQEADSIGDRCHWVQSKDTPKIPPPSKKVKRYKKKHPHDSSQPSFSGDERTKSSKLWDGSYDSSSDGGDGDESASKKAKLKADGSAWNEQCNAASTSKSEKTPENACMEDACHQFAQCKTKGAFVQKTEASDQVTDGESIALPATSSVKVEPSVYVKSEPFSSPGPSNENDSHDGLQHFLQPGKAPPSPVHLLPNRQVLGKQSTWTPSWPGAGRPATTRGGISGLPGASLKEDTKDIPLDLTSKTSSTPKVKQSPSPRPKSAESKTPTNFHQQSEAGPKRASHTATSTVVVNNTSTSCDSPILSAQASVFPPPPYPVPGFFCPSAAPLTGNPPSCIPETKPCGKEEKSDEGNAAAEQKNCTFGLNDYGMNYPLFAAYLSAQHTAAKKELEKPVNLCSKESTNGNEKSQSSEKDASLKDSKYASQAADSKNPGFPGWLEASPLAYLSMYSPYYQYYSYAAYGIPPSFPNASSSAETPLDLTSEKVVLSGKKNDGDKASKKVKSNTVNKPATDPKEKTGSR